MLNNLNKVRSLNSSNASFISRIKYLGTIASGLFLNVRIFISQPQLFHVLGFYNEALPSYSIDKSETKKISFYFIKT